jgi:hypothetical protein
MAKSKRENLVVLARRKQWLERRCSEAASQGRHTGYDDAERHALKWTLQTLCNRFKFDVREIEMAAVKKNEMEA